MELIDFSQNAGATKHSGRMEGCMGVNFNNTQLNMTLNQEWPEHLCGRSVKRGITNLQGPIKYTYIFQS